MISIVVPVYNVERYLSTCIESILTQDYTDFELILIDDGSNDKSGLICDKYAKKDDRIKVFHIENKGVSNARNLGINYSQGQYICFIDSDDWVDNTYLSNLMSLQKNTDLVILNMISNVDNKPIFRLKSQIEIYNSQFIGKAIKEYNLLSYGSPWMKLYNKYIIDKFNIRFPTSISFGEDSIFFFNYLTHSNSIAIIDKYLYNYRVTGENSLSKKIHNPIDILYYLIREKYFYYIFYDKYTIASYDRKFYSKYVNLHLKKIINNYINCFVLNLDSDTKKKVWIKSLISIKYKLFAVKGFNIEKIISVLILFTPFFIFDKLIKLYHVLNKIFNK